MSKALGRFVVSDPAVCHGRPTFRGTRVFVSDVLDDVARGMAWEAIIERWHGSISKEAIGEAVRLAREALLNHARVSQAGIRVHRLHGQEEETIVGDL